MAPERTSSGNQARAFPPGQSGRPPTKAAAGALATALRARHATVKQRLAKLRRIRGLRLQRRAKALRQLDALRRKEALLHE
jgi:hypothetical protein